MIEKLYRGKCSGPCERWVPRPDVVPQVVGTESTSGAYLATSDIFIKDEAIRRNWTIFPLTCPDCRPDLLVHGRPGQEGPRPGRRNRAPWHSSSTGR